MRGASRARPRRLGTHDAARTPHRHQRRRALCRPRHTWPRMKGQAETPGQVSDLAWIEITYSTRDRFGVDQEGDPNHRYVQHIQAEIAGYDDAQERSVPL